MTQKQIQEKITNGAKLILKNKKNLTDKFTDDKIASMCIDYVWDRDSSSGGHKIIKNILPDVNLGYGGSEGGWYGNGSTRMICKANYALRSTFTIEQVKLTQGIFNGMSDEFDNLVDKLSKDYSKQDPKVEFKHSTDYVTKHSSNKLDRMLLASGSLDINSKGTHTEIMLSNIQKNGRNYVGDLSVHIVRLLGTGGNFYPAQKKYTQEDMDTYHSLVTSDLYNPQTDAAKPTSNNFKQKIQTELSRFKEHAQSYKNIVEKSGKPMREYHIITVYNF